MNDDHQQKLIDYALRLAVEGKHQAITPMMIDALIWDRHALLDAVAITHQTTTPRIDI